MWLAETSKNVKISLKDRIETVWREDELIKENNVQSDYKPVVAMQLLIIHLLFDESWTDSN